MDLGKLRELAVRRECVVCGKVFEGVKPGEAMGKWADHIVEHQPTSAQWTEAYNKIPRRVRTAES